MEELGNLTVKTVAECAEHEWSNKVKGGVVSFLDTVLKKHAKLNPKAPDSAQVVNAPPLLACEVFTFCACAGGCLVGGVRSA